MKRSIQYEDLAVNSSTFSNSFVCFFFCPRDRSYLSFNRCESRGRSTTFFTQVPFVYSFSRNVRENVARETSAAKASAVSRSRRPARRPFPPRDERVQNARVVTYCACARRGSVRRPRARQTREIRRRRARAKRLWNSAQTVVDVRKHCLYTACIAARIGFVFFRKHFFFLYSKSSTFFSPQSTTQNNFNQTIRNR